MMAIEVGMIIAPPIPISAAGEDQRDRPVDQAAQAEDSAEDGHAGHQHGPMTVPVAERAGGEEGGGEEQRVDPERPLQLARGGAEAVDRVGEALQRDAEHGRVDPDQDRGHDENREDPALPPRDRQDALVTPMIDRFLT